MIKIKAVLTYYVDTDDEDTAKDVVKQDVEYSFSCPSTIDDIAYTAEMKKMRVKSKDPFDKDIIVFEEEGEGK